MRAVHVFILWPICLVWLVGFLAACDRGKEKEPVEEQIIKVREFGQCDNDCIFARDLECDDGGVGSTTNYCAYGHDCKDCGERITIEVVQ